MPMFCRNVPAATLLLTALAAATTFRADNARTGRVAMAIGTPLNRAYTCATGAPVISSPIASGDTIYFGSRDSSIYALSKETILWRFKTRGWVDATPALHQGRIYAGSRDGLLYILDAATGDSLGVIENNNEQCASPLVADTLIVFGRGGWNTQIDAYDLRTGLYTWFKPNTQMVYSSAALQDTILCYADNSGALTALEFHSGRQLWSHATGGGTYLSSPAIDNGVVWFSPGSYDKNTYALSLGNGVLLWKNSSAAEKAADPVETRVLTAVLGADPDRQTRLVEGMARSRAISEAQRSLLLKAAAARGSDAVFIPFGGVATSSVAIGNDFVFVCHKEFGYPKPRFSITAFDRTSGQEQWQFSELRTCEGVGFCSSPLTTDSLVFFGWGEGRVYALRQSNGQQMWQDSLDGDILASPVASRGKVTFVTSAGTVYTYVGTGYAEETFQNMTYAYPNPARGAVSTIQMYAGAAADLELKVYNYANRPVLTDSRTVAAGLHTYTWNVTAVANGVYFAHVTVSYADGSKDRKIIKIAVLH